MRSVIYEVSVQEKQELDRTLYKAWRATMLKYGRNKQLAPVSGDYITAFIDGEGCFTFQLRSDRRYSPDKTLKKVYRYFTPRLVITLHEADMGLLQKIQISLGVGNTLLIEKYGHARYDVGRLEDLYTVIIPHFEKHPLQGRKYEDYKLWKEAVELLWQFRTTKDSRHAKMGEEMIARLTEIQKKMVEHKSYQ